MDKFTLSISTCDPGMTSGFGQSLNEKQMAFVEAIEVTEDEGKEVSFATFRRRCEGVNDWAQEHGYAVGKERGLHLDKDWCVRVYRSVFNGKPCYYLDWSMHQFIWQ